MTDKNTAALAADHLRSHGDDIYEWAIDADDRIRCLHAENETLRAGYAAARLEIESLRARSVEPTTVNRYCRAGMCVPSDTKHEPWCTAHRQPPAASA